MDLKKEIETILKITNWSSNKNSEEVKMLKSVYFKLFEKRLKINCGSCIQSAYYEIKDLYENEQTLKHKIMGEFKIAKDKQIHCFETHEVLTASNITDEKALNLLRLNKKNIAHFLEYPENWEELLKNPDAKASVANTSDAKIEEPKSKSAATKKAKK